jgi:hypothetical protein
MAAAHYGVFVRFVNRNSLFLNRSGSRPQDPFSVDPKYVDILLPREGEAVIELGRSNGDFTAFCGVGLKYSLLTLCPYHSTRPVEVDGRSQHNEDQRQVFVARC